MIRSHTWIVKRKTPLLLAAILGLVAILFSLKIISQSSHWPDDHHSAGERKNPSEAALDADINRSTPTKSDRADAAYKKSLQEMEREFDEILPAKFPDQFSSLCDANLEPGDHLILGGFKNADGNFEFNSLNLEAVEVDGTTQHVVHMKTFTMDQTSVSELGLDPLVSPAKKRIQQSIVFPAGQSSRMVSAIEIMSSPAIRVNPGQPGSINMGTDKQALVLSVITQPGDDGNSIRVRTRIESPAGTTHP